MCGCRWGARGCWSRTFPSDGAYVIIKCERRDIDAIGLGEIPTKRNAEEPIVIPMEYLLDDPSRIGCKETEFGREPHRVNHESAFLKSRAQSLFCEKYQMGTRLQDDGVNSVDIFHIDPIDVGCLDKQPPSGFQRSVNCAECLDRIWEMLNHIEQSDGIKSVLRKAALFNGFFADDKSLCTGPLGRPR